MDSFVKRRIHPLLLFLAISSMFSCALPFEIPGINPTTAAPVGIETIIAQTAGAAATKTALLFTSTLTPSFTPFPTKVPSVTPTVTPTFIFVLTSPTSVPGLIITPSTPITPSSTDFECQLIGQSPANDSTQASNQNFVTIWTVANSGRQTWDRTSVDFIYLSGARIGKSKAADLPKSVASGEAVSLKMTMTAPKNSGTYRTVWALRIGQNNFCTMSLRIVVP
jgi:hypothetical protein